jgi:hypothetical protein
MHHPYAKTRANLIAVAQGSFVYRIHSDTGEILVRHLFEDGIHGVADRNPGERDHVPDRTATAQLSRGSGLALYSFCIAMSSSSVNRPRFVSSSFAILDSNSFQRKISGAARQGDCSEHRPVADLKLLEHVMKMDLDGAVSNV